jgi:hypothetical protein
MSDILDTLYSHPNGGSNIVATVPKNLEKNPILCLVTESEAQRYSLLQLAYKVCDVRVKKTEKEKDERKRIYRKEYVTRPSVQEKIKARLADEEIQKKKREYAAREDVKKRKQELAREGRLIKKKLKAENPDLYKQIAQAVKESIITCEDVEEEV